MAQVASSGANTAFHFVCRARSAGKVVVARQGKSESAGNPWGGGAARTTGGDFWMGAVTAVNFE